MTKVSILIPAYNAERFIDRCIRSAMKQTLREIEIIAVNDGSSDNTLAIMKKMADEDLRIQIINQKNAGVSAARNAALARADGEYLLQLDSDDWIEPGCCEILYDFAKETNADIVVFNYFIDYENGRQLVSSGQIFEEWNNLSFIAAIFCGKMTPRIICKFFKKSLYSDHMITYPENTGLGEDMAAIIPLAYYSSRIAGLEKYLYHYCHHRSSITKTYNEKMLDIFIAIDHIEEFIKKQGLLEYFSKEFVYFKYLHVLIYRIVEVPSYSPVKLKVYQKWQAQNCPVLNNELCRDSLRKKGIFFRVIVYSYCRNYRLGNAVQCLYHHSVQLGSRIFEAASMMGFPNINSIKKSSLYKKLFV